jgi:abortive infection Abi-like protein
MPEAVVRAFVMHRTRTAMGLGLSHIEEHVQGIERAVVENPALAFDLARTLIETACRTILTERNVAFDIGDDLPKTFKATTQVLPFLPPAARGEGKARKSLARTLNGLNTTVQGVCELRNAYGFASHGSASPRQTMETEQAALAASAADTIIGFIYGVHLQDQTIRPRQGSNYAKNPAFNDHVDDIHEAIRIFELQFHPSEVLFQMDPEAYRNYLAEYVAESHVGEGPAQKTGKSIVDQ